MLVESYAQYSLSGRRLPWRRANERTDSSNIDANSLLLSCEEMSSPQGCVWLSAQYLKYIIARLPPRMR